MRPETEKIFTASYCGPASATAAFGAAYGLTPVSVSAIGSPLPGLNSIIARHDRRPARSSRLAHGGREARRAAPRPRRRPEPGARRDQRAQREEGPAAGAALRRDPGLSQGL